VAAEVKRVALLGATGSIGRQALEVIAGDPALEACALSSGVSRAESMITRSRSQGL